MQRRPLPDHFRIGARVLNLIRGCAGILIGGDIANAIARCPEWRGVRLRRDHQTCRERQRAPAQLN